MKAPTCLEAEYRAVPGWPLSVSAAGVVRGPRGVRRTNVDREGYAYVSARKPGRPWPLKLRVHVAVLLAWAGPCPPGHEGRHENGDHLDNRIENLSWATHVVNMGDKWAHGTMPLGSAVHNSKLTDEQVREIRRLWGTVRSVAIAERFGIHPASVWKIATRRRWGHLR